VTPDEPHDYIDDIRNQDARRAARERAIAGPQRPHRRTKTPGTGGYTGAALSAEIEAVRKASKGTRQTTLNTACFNLGQLVQPGGLDYDTVAREMRSAALAAGLTERELKQWDLPDRGIQDGMTKARDLSKLDGALYINSSSRSNHSTAQDGGSDEFGERRLILRRMSTVKTRVPQWVWRYKDQPCLQLGTFVMFAGKSGVGKSTAARWFAARITRGELPGVWEDHPMNVAVIMQEEQTDMTIAPGLVAAQADMDRIFDPVIHESGTEQLFASLRDEQVFTELLLDYDIRAVFVDPVMSTLSGKMDAYRNNEVRQFLMPYARIAKAIDGIVLGVHHFRKGTTESVMDSLTGSSAFVEMPRAVFGFAADNTGMCVMEQVKNSAGPCGLKLEYHLPVEYITMDDGVTEEISRFELRGETTVGVTDINPSTDELTGIAFACEWLTDYLSVNQPAPVWQVQKDAKAAGAINNDRMLSRAKQRLGVISKSEPVAGKPNQHVWMLPEFAKDFGKWRRTP
jgi:AAA domain